MAKDDFQRRIADGYVTSGPAIELGAAVYDSKVLQSAPLRLPLSSMNRHGLIAGATGTGKTRTLQLLAEQLSSAGVPVFTADMKGDLTGLMEQQGPDPKVAERVDSLGLKDWNPAAYPVTFMSLGGIGTGVPLRASVESFGAQLLSKVVGANDTQTSSLALVFHYARAKDLQLVDLKDLRAVLTFLTSDSGRDELKSIGGLSSATAGVLLRKILELQEQGADALFGEPEISVGDLLQSTEDGRGVISCLELPAVQDRPKLFSTFMMWLLSKLFKELPEVGDLPKPKLVFFFDEAHLLFDDASKSFIDSVAQTVRLIRSKGVGVFFVTHYPDDVPDEVLGQLGNRIQHALRAYTPRDAKALKATVTTYPKTSDYDLEEDLTRLGTGEAIVTVLSEGGAPTPVAWTRMRPPQASMGAADPSAVEASVRAGDLWKRLSTRIEVESAAERIEAKLGASWNVTLERPRASTGRRSERSRGPAKGSRGSRDRGERSRMSAEKLLFLVILVALVVVIGVVFISLNR